MWKCIWNVQKRKKTSGTHGLLTPGVSECVRLSGGKPQCLSGNKTGCSQPSGVTVPWGETEAAKPVGMENRHMPRRHVGDKAGTWSRTGLTVSAAQWCAKSWQIQVLIALRKRWPEQTKCSSKAVPSALIYLHLIWHFGITIWPLLLHPCSHFSNFWHVFLISTAQTCLALSLFCVKTFL